MSRNIKEIGKELMGKSLNSFHRKTGLTQLEKNNEMQDGILDGILSQVDDAYIEKTEQSNVIHLDGSGDGVVVLDNIEGNTMVNIFNNVTGTVSLDNVVSSYANNTLTYKAQSGFEGNIYPAFLGSLVTNYNLSTNKKYTFVFESNIQGAEFGLQGVKSDGRWVEGMTIKTIAKIGVNIIEFTTPNDLSEMNALKFRLYNSTTNNEHKFSNFQIYEGDISTLPNGYFKGMKSSFEDKVNNEGKYEIEILSKNKNLYPFDKLTYATMNEFKNTTKGHLKLKSNTQYYIKIDNIITSTNYCRVGMVLIKDGKNITNSGNLIFESNNLSMHFREDTGYPRFQSSGDVPNSGEKFIKITPTTDCELFIAFHQGTEYDTNTNGRIQIEKGSDATSYISHKSNKIKLLINEPLRGLEGNIKDKLLIKDNKLVIERNCNIYKLNSKDIIGYGVPSDDAKTVRFGVYWGSKNDNKFNLDGSFNTRSICNILPYNTMWSKDEVGFYCDGWNSSSDDALRQIVFRLDKNIVGSTLNSLKSWIDNNEIIVVYKTLKPIYEEVLNEYGEPIILEGYENGTLYIDSTIVPTTTVRYTPKMESFKTLNEVSDNNTMLANDINDNIIPYMMDVDFMIMEKEMALMSHKNIRKMEILDMTSMQKRTQDMLERLIKGKTLTEQECKTRITTYLNAGKITDTQAEELNFLIDEIYA